MESRTYSVEVNDIPLDGVEQERLSGPSDDVHHQIHLRRARTDVHMSRRNVDAPSKFHSYGGREHRLINTLPSRSGYDYLGSHHQHYGADRRPSAWFNTVMARRRKGVAPQTDEEAVDEITEAMGGDEKLMSDDVDGRIMRREALRELCKPLNVKKEIRRRLTARQTSSQAASRTISGWKHFKYTMSMRGYKMMQSIQDAFHDYSLWHKELKVIEGTFGTGVGSYFRFLRYLFILNLLIALLVCGFILTPQLLYRFSVEKTMMTATENPITAFVNQSIDGKIASLLPVSDDVAFSDDSVPFSDHNASSSFDRAIARSTYASSPSKFGPIDWLTGSGWFDNTGLYYGTYHNGSFSLVSGLYYDIAVAYFFVIFISFLIYLIVILHRVIVLYKNNYIDTVHDMSSTFIKKVFSSWDFTISNKKAAALRHRSIYNELTELIQEYLNEDLNESCCGHLMALCVKFVFWAIVCGVLAVLGWCMYLMLDNGINENVANNSEVSLLIYPLIVTLFMIVVPVLFEVIVKIEGYRSPRQILYVTLVRTIILELTVLGVLVGFWYTREHVPVKDMSTTAAATGTPSTVDATEVSISTDITGSTTSATTSTPDLQESYCWETSLGEEVYRLLIIDFLVSLLLNIAGLIFSAATRKKSLGSIQEYLLEFNISRNTLHLIYNQTLLWAGLFFCPLTPLIVLLKMAITFYIQKFITLRFLRAEERPWRAAQTETVFFALTLVSLILSFFAYGFIIISGDSSPYCGPFQGYEHYVDFLWDMTENQGIILQVIGWILRPGVVAGILGILVILVYCAKSMADGRAEMINVLRQQLELEVRDRAFLLQLTEKVRRGEYKPCSPKNKQQDFSQSPSSSRTDPHHLTQRGSFIFTNNKVHPADEGSSQRYFGSGSDADQESSAPLFSRH